ncbi:MAG: hypothetical protein WKF86_04860 [Acidimicrobiales bacterium]
MRPAREITLDDRRRTSLARIGRDSDHRYLIDELPDGTVILIPAVTLSKVELAALSDPEARAAMDRASARADSAEPEALRSRGSFARFVEEESV